MKDMLGLLIVALLVTCSVVPRPDSALNALGRETASYRLVLPFNLTPIAQAAGVLEDLLAGR